MLAPYRAAGLSMEFHGLDGARLTGDSLWASELNGRLECAFSAPNLQEWLTPTTLAEARARESSANLHLTLQPSEWREGRISSFAFDASLAAGVLDFQGRVESEFGNAQWTGNARPFGHAPEARLTSLTLENCDLGLLLHIPSMRSRIGGRLTAEGSGATLDSLDARWGLALDGSSVGERRLGRLRFSGNIVRGAIDARIEADQDADSVLARVAARVELGRPGHGLSVDGRVQGAARFGAATFDTVSSDFALANGVLDLRRLEIAGNVAAVSARGRIALSGAAASESTDVGLVGRIRDLSSLGARVGLVPLGVGVGGFALTARGTRGRLELTATARGTNLRAGTSRADSLDLVVNATVRGDSLARLDARAFFQGLVPDGYEERDLETRAKWDGRELGVEAHAKLILRGTQDLAVRFERRGDALHVALDQLDSHGLRTHFALERPATADLGSVIAVDHLSILQDGRPCVRANGALGQASSPGLEVAIDSLDVSAPFWWFGLPGVRGHVTAAAMLTGTRRAPVVNASLRGAIAPSRGRSARLDGQLSWHSDSLYSRVRFAQNEHEYIAVSTTLPLALDLDPPAGGRFLSLRDDSLSVSLEARQLDLAWFEQMISPRAVRKLAGRVNGSVHLGGTPARPGFTGALALTHLRAQVPPVATTFEAKEVKLAFHPRSIELEPSVVTSSGGRLQLSGAVSFEHAGQRAFELHGALSKFQIMNTGLARVQLNGQLDASGAFDRPEVTGKIELANSTLYLESGTPDRQLERVQLTERDWRELEMRFSDTDATGDRNFTGLADSVRIDVALKVGQNVWVRRRSDPIVALEMSGEVHATHDRGAPPQIAGRLEVETGRSYLSFLNRRFDLTRARVELPGPIPNASAELEAQYLSDSNGSDESQPAPM